MGYEELSVLESRWTSGGGGKSYRAETKDQEWALV